MDIKLKLKPFGTPNFVLAETSASYSRTDGPPSFPLSDVDAESLSAMCDAFREEVFKKAGKEDPRIGIIDPA